MRKIKYILYFSKTHQTARFMEKLQVEFPTANIVRIIDPQKMEMLAPYVLFTPTYNFGKVPKETQEFLEAHDNYKYMRAVASNGNRNWGAENFAKSGELISKQYQVPLLHKFELRGNSEDIRIVKEALVKLGY